MKYQRLIKIFPNEILLSCICALTCFFSPAAATPELQAGEVQWASEVLGVSSETSAMAGSAKQALGKPSVMPGFGESPCAWRPSRESSNKSEWIKVAFDSAVHARQIAVAENFNPGTIERIYLYDENGAEYLVYSMRAKRTLPASGRMKNIVIARTEYKVKAVKVILNTSPVDGFNQIDAIGLADFVEPVKHEINLSGKSLIKSKPENLGENVNSPFSELAPVISPDGKTLYYTRGGHPQNIGSDEDQDVWFSEIGKDGKFAPAKNIGYPINNSFNNFAISITPDGNTLILGKIYKPEKNRKKGISVSYFNGLGWDYPKNINVKNFYNNYKFASYCLGSDGKTLILSVTRDDSYGGTDLYVSFLEEDGAWTEPANLGPGVNTAANEDTPFLASDGTTLYYSTSGQCGYGSNDMFIIRRLDDSFQKWTEPANLGPELNTAGWDAYFTIPASGAHAYFVSSKNSYGRADVFRALLPNELRPKPVVLISGKVLNAKTKNPLSAKIIYETLPSGKEVGIARSNPITGDYKIVLPAGAKYGFLAVADSFVAVNQNLDLRKTKNYAEISRDLFLVPIEHGQKVQLNNIFFEFAKVDLLEDSFSELNRVAEFMRNNQDISIEIMGHTDSVGSWGANLALSKNRARSVAKYLVSKGISKNRLRTKGLGKSKPIAPNDTEENRRKNRRVEFIMKKK